jgi:hypothetical protein
MRCETFGVGDCRNHRSGRVESGTGHFNNMNLFREVINGKGTAESSRTKRGQHVTRTSDVITN